jgi:hypothetical protein
MKRFGLLVCFLPAFALPGEAAAQTTPTSDGPSLIVAAGIGGISERSSDGAALNLGVGVQWSLGRTWIGRGEVGLMTVSAGSPLHEIRLPRMGVAAVRNVTMPRVSPVVQPYIGLGIRGTAYRFDASPDQNTVRWGPYLIVGGETPLGRSSGLRAELSLHAHEGFDDGGLNASVMYTGGVSVSVRIGFRP